MLNIVSLLQRGWPIFEKGGKEKVERYFRKRDKTSSETMPYMVQGSSKAFIVCSSGGLLTVFLEISTLDLSFFFPCE